MKRVTETVEIAYKLFDVGEMVVANSARCGLEMGREYEVTECIPPLIPYETDSIIFVVGLDHGIDTEYVSPAEKEEPSVPLKEFVITVSLTATIKAESEKAFWDERFEADPRDWMAKIMRGGWSFSVDYCEEV